MKQARTLKLIAVVAALMVFFAAVSVAYGGLRWTGIDPAFELSDGTPVNVYIAVPGKNWCNLNSPIPVTITAPVNLGTQVEESILERTCKGITDTLTTATTLIVGKHDDQIKVKVYASSNVRRAKFPVEVLIKVDGIELKVCSGRVNDTVKCSVNLDDTDEGGKEGAHGKKGRKSRSR